MWPFFFCLAVGHQSFNLFYFFFCHVQNILGVTCTYHNQFFIVRLQPNHSLYVCLCAIDWSWLWCRVHFPFFFVLVTWTSSEKSRYLCGYLFKVVIKTETSVNPLFLVESFIPSVASGVRNYGQSSVSACVWMGEKCVTIVIVCMENLAHHIHIIWLAHAETIHIENVVKQRTIATAPFLPKTYLLKLNGEGLNHR